MKKQLIDEQYGGIIAQADLQFKQLLYNEAATKYKEAIQIKPGETQHYHQNGVFYRPLSLLVGVDCFNQTDTERLFGQRFTAWLAKAAAQLQAGRV